MVRRALSRGRIFQLQRQATGRKDFLTQLSGFVK
jgi:hypothetical protein